MALSQKLLKSGNKLEVFRRMVEEYGKRRNVSEIGGTYQKVQKCGADLWKVLKSGDKWCRGYWKIVLDGEIKWKDREMCRKMIESVERQ